MTLNGVMRYFTEFGKQGKLGKLPTHNRRVDLWRNLFELRIVRQ